MKSSNDSFVLYTSYADNLKKLPLEQVGAVLLAIMDYVKDGTIPTLEPAADMCFSFIKSQIDRDKEKYENVKKIRAESGSKGGKKRAENIIANQANATFATTSKANQAVNVYDYDNVNDNEYDNRYINTPAPSPKAKEKNAPKKPKKVKYAEYVSMTKEEHEKLIEQYGEGMTARMVEVLDNYKGQSGKTYKNDYRAILNWVVNKVKEEQKQENTPAPQNGTYSFKASTGFSGGSKENGFTPSNGFKKAD